MDPAGFIDGRVDALKPPDVALSLLEGCFEKILDLCEIVQLDRDCPHEVNRDGNTAALIRSVHVRRCVRGRILAPYHFFAPRAEAFWWPEREFQAGEVQLHLLRDSRRVCGGRKRYDRTSQR